MKSISETCDLGMVRAKDLVSAEAQLISVPSFGRNPLPLVRSPLVDLRSPLIGLRRKCDATGLVGAAEI